MRRTLDIHVSDDAVWTDSGETERFADDVGGALTLLLKRLSPDPRSSFRLMLHPPMVQLRTLHDVPSLSSRDLNAMVALHASRFFRSVDAKLVTAATWVPTEHGRAPRAAAVSADELLTMERVVTTAGFRLVGVSAVGSDASPPITLRTPTLERRHRRRSQLRIGAQVVLALSGWVAAAVVYAVDLSLDARRIETELEQLAGPLNRLQEIEQRLGRFAPVASAMRRQSAPDRRLTPNLARIAATLPVSTHAHRIVLDSEGAARLEAHGPDPVELVQRLAAWWPGRVRVEGTVDAVEGEQLFTIAMERR